MTPRGKPATVVIQEDGRTLRYRKSNASPETAIRDQRATAAWLREIAALVDRWADAAEAAQYDTPVPDAGDVAPLTGGAPSAV